MNRTNVHLLLGLGILAAAAGVATIIYFPTTRPVPTVPPPMTIAAEPVIAATQLTGGWDDQFVRGTDPVSGDRALYLSGHFVLSDPNAGQPGRVEGTLTVDLYDPKVSAGSDPIPLEQWIFDPATLAVIGKPHKDGCEVVLRLPWRTYKPEIEAVKLVVRFQQAERQELRQESNITLDRTAVPTGDK